MDIEDIDKDCTRLLKRLVESLVRMSLKLDLKVDGMFARGRESRRLLPSRLIDRPLLTAYLTPPPNSTSLLLFITFETYGLKLLRPSRSQGQTVIAIVFTQEELRTENPYRIFGAKVRTVPLLDHNACPNRSLYIS